jgi:hypothetical protein
MAAATRVLRVSVPVVRTLGAAARRISVSVRVPRIFHVACPTGCSSVVGAAARMRRWPLSGCRWVARPISLTGTRALMARVAVVTVVRRLPVALVALQRTG